MWGKGGEGMSEGEREGRGRQYDGIGWSVVGGRAGARWEAGWGGRAASEEVGRDGRGGREDGAGGRGQMSEPDSKEREGRAGQDGTGCETGKRPWKTACPSTRLRASGLQRPTPMKRTALSRPWRRTS